LAHGAPIEVLTKENVKDVFGVDVLLDANPLSGGLRVTHILN
jgi:ABC-type cobalamin/Fe3+-siderophores transport system ATPase subunit